MTNTKHTPTPWYLEPRHASSDDVIASVIGTTDIISAKHPATFANAAHIVKCVNMHDELVEVLQWISDNSMCEGAVFASSEALKKAGAL